MCWNVLYYISTSTTQNDHQKCIFKNSFSTIICTGCSHTQYKKKYNNIHGSPKRSNTIQTQPVYHGMQIPHYPYQQPHAMKAVLELQPSSAKIMKSYIFKCYKTLCTLFIWLEIRKNNVFTWSYLCSRGFFGSNISSDYSVAWRRILNYGRRLLCFTKPTLVTITRCWCRWSRFCNALNIYLSCSCWC